MARLYAALAFGDRVVTVPPGPFPGLIIPVDHPAPGQAIGITRSICRIHLVGRRIAGIHATALFFARASDLSIIGGVATDALEDYTQRTPIEAFGDRDIDFAPNFVFLGGGDSLVGIYRTFTHGVVGDPSGFEARLDILFAYHKFSESPFVRIIDTMSGSPASMAHALIGIKENGTTWTATFTPSAPAALVWTQV